MSGRPVTVLKGLYLQNYTSELNAIFTVGLTHSIKLGCYQIGLIWAIGVARSACRVKSVKMAR